ncbi:hypothetical protein Ocin01_16942 [Orchesella cincta]|uniref:Uncharacterized protein n=1 Tax=Orchesella cincta TaxID=48709 RepID=A0A1D2M9Y9_ORCCI|nr:hypothetical protein Ocin01_16942 [Orchesella cincta]
MRFSWDCGISFKIWSVATIVLEILFTLVTAGITGWALLLQQTAGHKLELLYTPKPKETYIQVNANYSDVVTTWVLFLLLLLCIGRFLTAVMLLIGIKKSSVNLAKFWIAFKVFAVMMSLFLVTASFTVSMLVKAAACASLITDLITCYFIMILYPELDQMRKVIPKVDPTPHQ